MIFPQANDESIDDLNFLAAWSVWFSGDSSRGVVDGHGPVPRLNRKECFQQLSEKAGHGLDMLCRYLVPVPYRNTMQVTKAFMERNSHLLEPVQVVNPIKPRGKLGVNGAKLTSLGLRLLSEVERDQTRMRDMEAIIEADAECESSGGAPSLLSVTASKQFCESPPGDRPAHRIADRAALIAALVIQIEEAEFQPRYRGRVVARPVYGWANRLRTYFWPNQKCDFGQTVASLEPLLAEGATLAQAPRPWDTSTQKRAEQFAATVFKWGGVPQRDATGQKIESVIKAALFRIAGDAPMNSGWTKLAAFVTAHLETQGQSQAIWDSRVSWSLVRRIDGLLYMAGHGEVPQWLKHIGRVPGRGGTRWQTPLQLCWPYAYGRWDAHLAASEFIREIRDQLNRQNLQAPKVKGGSEPWTVRAVEMVLFMDGY